MSHLLPQGRVPNAVMVAGILLVILTAAAYLRGEGLGRDSVWHDEAHSALMARTPDALDLVRRSAVEDVHPPFYYLILHYWTALTGGDDEARLRTPSVIFGVLGVLAMFFVARELAGVHVGLWSAVLLAVSVFHVQYSREARMYTLLLFFSLASMYAFVRLGTATWRRAALWVVLTGALLMTHAVAVFMLAVQHLCWALLYIRRDSRHLVPAISRWVVLNVVLGLLVAPWFVMALRQVGRVNDGFWIPRPYLTAPLDIFVTLTGSTWFAIVIASLVVVGILWRPRPGAAVAQSLAWPAASVSLILLIWGIVPVLAPWVWSYIGAPILLPRIVIASLAPLLILAAIGVNAIRPQWAGVAAGVVLVCTQAVTSWNYTQRLTKEDWRSASAFVSRAHEPGDLLLFHQAHRWKGLDYYMREPAAVIAGFPARRFRENDTVRAEEVAQLDAIVAPHTRVWLISAISRDPERLIDKRLEQHFDVLEEREFRQLRIRLFARPVSRDSAGAAAVAALRPR